MSKKNKHQKDLKRKLFLDRPTPHGGWPNGKDNSWSGNKAVKDIIYDYLESMGLTADVPHARLSEASVRRMILESLTRILK